MPTLRDPMRQSQRGAPWRNRSMASRTSRRSFSRSKKASAVTGTLVVNMAPSQSC
ncbi:MAG: hypothetical protein QM765_46490 [Myxococcales bacterium]